MFSKAKLKRFNEEVGCAPPPTKYDTKVKDKAIGGTIDKSKRWTEKGSGVPSPTAYHGDVFASPAPKKSSSRHNTSTASTSSTDSLFIPSNAFARSKSARSFSYQPRKSIISTKEDIEIELKKVISERNDLKMRVEQLEIQITKLSDVSINSSINQEKKDSFSQVDFELDSNNSQVSFIEELDAAKQRICSLEDENAQLVCKVNVLEKTINEEDIGSIKDQINHLTSLRDNLESSILYKDDLIAELQLQYDQVVAEARTQEEKLQKLKDEAQSAQDQLKKVEEEKTEVQNKVQSLVALYEGLRTKHTEDQEVLTKKDIEIELLNESVNSLSRRLSEKESMLEESHLHISRISSLEMTVSELSMVSKEKEIVESMMQDELKQRDQDITKLENNLEEVEARMDEVLKDRDQLIDSLEDEKHRVDEMSDKVKELERNLKEREVVQQFLEKEVASREAECAESALTVENLKSELETARQVALDLQQEVEAKANEILSLNAKLSVKDYDIDARDETICSLKDELIEQSNKSLELNTKLSKEYVNQKIYKEKLDLIDDLETKLSEALEANKVADENTGQLEEKVIDLMAEISDRDTEYTSKMRELESELEELSVKYSDSLLEHEATRRALNMVSDELHKEKLLLEASEGILEDTKGKLEKITSSHEDLQNKMQESNEKFAELKSTLENVECERNEFAKQLHSEQEITKTTTINLQDKIQILQSSNTGFMSQITQLRIDIRKKSEAVEDMKLCIEGLREEKNHLISLRDNLENTLENKEQIIEKLKSDLQEARSQDQEEKKVQEEKVSILTSRIADLENHTKEDTQVKSQMKAELSELKESHELLQKEKDSIEQTYENHIQEFNDQQTKLNELLEQLRNKHETCDDQINQLQASLFEKALETEKLERQLEENKKLLNEKQSNLENLTEQMDKLKNETNTLSKSIESKDILVSSLNTTLIEKTEEVRGLYKTLEEKQSSLVILEERVGYLEETEDKLASERDIAAKQLTMLRDTLNETKEKLNRLETSYRDETAAEITKCQEEFESSISMMNDKNKTLEEEVNMWKTKFEQLEKMIEPFREQLDAFEVERLNLISNSTAAKDEIDKLSKQYAQLLGHSNHKQKIQHVIKLKSENNKFKEEIQKLRLEVDRQRKSVRRLEEKLDKQSGKSKLNDMSKILTDKENNFSHLNETRNTMSKENFSLLLGANESLIASTPAKSSKKPQRL